MRKSEAMTTGNGVLCIGAIMVDVLCMVDRLPERGEGVVTTDRRMMLGGCAFNTCNVVRQLGVPCGLLAPVGKGFYADFVRSELSSRGLSGLDVPTGRDCGVCTAMIEPDGERTMVTSPGVERFFESRWFEGFDTSPYSCAVVAGYEVEGSGGEEIISFLESHTDLDLYYAPGPRVMGVSAEKHQRINALHPIWHLNDLEALQYTGADSVDCAGGLIAQECGNACVITCGSKGAGVYFEDGESVFVPTSPVQVVDTVGAGDSHVGALAASRAAGYSWEKSLLLANAVAGVVCSSAGGTVSDEAFLQSGLTLQG